MRCLPGQNLAVICQSLFLAICSSPPGICFAILFWLWRRNRTMPALARQHLKQTTYVSLWGGILIIVISGLFIALGGLHGNGPG